MKRFILTVGPALLHEVPLKEVHDDRNIYRINGAHGSIQEIEEYLLEIRRQIPDADILMDLPGNKVRTKNLPGGQIVLERGKEFSIPSECFNYTGFYKHLKKGMTAYANDSEFEFEVCDANEKEILFLSKSSGTLINNKGVHVRDIHEDIPFLFEKDLDLIQLANKYKLEFVGLSFVRCAENIQEAKSLLDGSIHIISKVETLQAVEDLNRILKMVEYILVDRGDLSTDIGVLNIPRFQRYIIDKANYDNVRVFLATQVLKNMEKKPLPTIGEVEALYEIYTSGVYGVQMSEETAVGSYVKECVNTLREMCEVVEKELISL